ncbi:hypothetical protein Nepgr_016769 [Nepenthes gracilis]|uniref:Superoxide dismutase copper/zinc binding domain-containing protein n=1 Tax=Nepenthes gracilis TaxID=150966 RepID=A0AAD3SN91_NEPGR|nr:hypothetical protein Nepgr_016769 [Nepenthes gracilis]
MINIHVTLANNTPLRMLCCNKFEGSISRELEYFSLPSELQFNPKLAPVVSTGIDGLTTVTGNISGLKSGLHGFHVHALGDTQMVACQLVSKRPLFNPAGKEHGAHDDENRHAGGLGNVTAGEDGTVNFPITDYQIPLSRTNSIVGRPVVVHADSDDLGRGSFKSIVECFLSWQNTSRFDIRAMEGNGMARERSIHGFQIPQLASAASTMEGRSLGSNSRHPRTS